MIVLMYVLMVLYIAASVLVAVVQIKSQLRLREVLDAAMIEIDLITKQNKMLRDVVRKYGIETAD